MKTPRKRAANIGNPTMEAILHGLFRFDEEWEAIRRIENIKGHFIAAKEQDDNVWPPTLKIWIRGYGLEEGDVEKGFLGHFALMRVVKLEDGKYTITMEKLDVKFNHHPQKKRAPQAHPDWGHAILRKLAKEPTYPTIEEARGIFAKLHEEFPKVSIPGQNHLYLMVYRKDRQPGELPVQKFKFFIEVTPEGAYVIRHKDNEKPKILKPPSSPDGVETPPETTAPEGFFTARVKLKRKK